MKTIVLEFKVFHFKLPEFEMSFSSIVSTQFLLSSKKNLQFEYIFWTHRRFTGNHVDNSNFY